MKPLLTFTPEMFAAAKTLRKDITRRVATTGNQQQLDRLAAAIEKDLHRNDGLYVWAKNPLVWRIEFKLL